MPDEIGPDDCLVIHARAFLAGFSGLSGMLEPMLRAHNALRDSGANDPHWSPQTPLLSTAHDVITTVVAACQRVAGPCNAALQGAEDPLLSIAVNDGMVVLSDLLQQLSKRIELPIGQWLTEMVAASVPREDWPGLWRVAVWIGAVLHYAEDAAVVLQAMMQFLTEGWIFETRRTGGEWLNEHGALAALDHYRRMPPLARSARQADVSMVVAHALLALGETAKARAELAVAVADDTAHARFLDPRDLVHLGLHSQIAHRGGTFLSHRGKDAKRQLMDHLGGPRPEVFLDIWAHPKGDTNRRFLWRNLAAVDAMHAFVTSNYAASDFCMKEVEAWGLLALARGREAATTRGWFFVIDGAPTGPSDAVLTAWTHHYRKDTSLDRAIKSSSAARGPDALGQRLLHGDAERTGSDAFNQALLRSGLLTAVPAEHVVPLAQESIASLLDLLRRGLALVGHGQGIAPGALDDLDAALSSEPLASAEQFIMVLRRAHSCLVAALRASPTFEPVVRCALLAMLATVEVVMHIVRHWAGGGPEEVGRSLVAFTKFGGVIDAAAEQFGTWCVALATAGFDAQGDNELFAGLVLGLLPIDHENAGGAVRVDADFDLPPELSLPAAFEAAGFGRRTVQVVCTRAPTFWQRVGVIAALSSFTSRSFLFVDIEGSGALDSRVGVLPMAEFPHVTLARIEDLPAP